MLSELVDILENIKSGLKRPGSVILVESQGIASGANGLMFRFRWYDEPELLQLNTFVPKLILETYQDEFFVDHIINVTNLELDKYELKKKGETK